MRVYRQLDCVFFSFFIVCFSVLCFLCTTCYNKLTYFPQCSYDNIISNRENFITHILLTKETDGVLIAGGEAMNCT